jgi:TM2 domain-containing membrane protein YozV
MAPPGWYDDPEHETLFRYWNGSEWTEHRSAKTQLGPARPQTATGTYPGEKSVGLALLFNFLWPGAGHLYAGVRTGFGITFCVIGAVLFLMSLTIILLVIAFPAWLVMAIWSMVDVNKRVKQRNRDLGYLVADDLTTARRTMR